MHETTNVAELIDVASLPSIPLTNRRQLPSCKACYLVLEQSNIIYVGKSSSLVLRWNNHSKLKHLKNRGTEIKIAWIECNDDKSMSLIENALIKTYNPELNGKSTEEERIYIQFALDKSHKEALIQWCAAHSTTMTEAIMQAILPYIEAGKVYRTQHHDTNK